MARPGRFRGHVDEHSGDHTLIRGLRGARAGQERRFSSPLLLLVIVLGVIVAACGGGDTIVATTESLDSVTTTSTVSVSEGEQSVQELLDSLVGSVVGDRDGALIVAVVGSDGSTSFATDGSDAEGDEPALDAAFGIGSLTKMFTSAVVLQLVGQGLVELDAPASDYVTRLSIPEGVTVRNLLQHTSGIPNFTDDAEAWARGFTEPERTWTPADTYSLVEGEDLLFNPGAQFSYSNTNYAVLGVLIEEVTGSSYADALAARILEPLDLNGTYLAGFQEGVEPFGAYTRVEGSLVPIDFPYTSIATGAWAAGGMVSTVGDMTTFMESLFDGHIITQESLDAMTEDPYDDYGLGIFKYPWLGEVYGHGGGIPGYGTLIMHSPDSGVTALWVITIDEFDIGSTFDPITERVFGG